jgi:hypothetical protein
MPDKRAELELLRLRGEAPLVRMKYGNRKTPAGTLGYIIGVDGPGLRVRFANGQNEAVYPTEVVEVV